MPVSAIDSILSPQALLADITVTHNLGAPIACSLLNRGLNDHYEIRTASGRYVLRIYRFQWRALEEILYELDLLLHLERAGVAVAVPIARRDGALVWPVEAPEGGRYGVLFMYAVGEHGPHSDQRSTLYGSAVARIHKAVAGFTSRHQRIGIDLAQLIDRPLMSIEPFLAKRPADWQDLQSIGALLKEHIADLAAEGLDTGVCHGDFHGGNCHIADGILTFFDFDLCGPGWPSYDAAVFWWSVARNKRSETLWPAYLDGYTAVRPMSELERTALPFFVAARQIWYLGGQTSLAPLFGSARLDDRFWQPNMTFLREWVTAHTWAT